MNRSRGNLVIRWGAWFLVPGLLVVVGFCVVECGKLLREEGDSFEQFRRFFVLRLATYSLIVLGIATFFLGFKTKTIGPSVRVAICVIFALVAGGLAQIVIPEISIAQLAYGELSEKEYKQGFRPSQFLQLYRGMSKEEVQTAIGFGDKNFFGNKPSPDYHVWMYSEPGTENYWRYAIYFDEDDKLEKLYVKYWFD